VHRPRCAALAGLGALAAAALTTATVHAFENTQSFDPVPAGRGYVYYVREADTDHQPISGRRVTMSVQHAPGPDATVAPSDAKGKPTGPAGQTASEVTGDDGLAFFVIKTSTTPGDNEFVWQDGTYTGQVVVVGKPLGAAATASPRGGGAGHHARTPARAVPAHGLPSSAMPPLAAGLLASLLVFLFAPPVVARRLERLQLAASAQPLSAAQRS
jgi:hypothetical protein